MADNKDQQVIDIKSAHAMITSNANSNSINAGDVKDMTAQNITLNAQNVNANAQQVMQQQNAPQQATNATTGILQGIAAKIDALIEAVKINRQPDKHTDETKGVDNAALGSQPVTVKLDTSVINERTFAESITRALTANETKEAFVSSIRDLLSDLGYALDNNSQATTANLNDFFTNNADLFNELVESVKSINLNNIDFANNNQIGVVDNIKSMSEEVLVKMQEYVAKSLNTNTNDVELNGLNKSLIEKYSTMHAELLAQRAQIEALIAEIKQTNSLSVDNQKSVEEAVKETVSGMSSVVENEAKTQFANAVEMAKDETLTNQDNATLQQTERPLEGETTSLANPEQSENLDRYNETLQAALTTEQSSVDESSIAGNITQIKTAIVDNIGASIGQKEGKLPAPTAAATLPNANATTLPLANSAQNVQTVGIQRERTQAGAAATLPNANATTPPSPTQNTLVDKQQDRSIQPAREHKPDEIKLKSLEALLSINVVMTAILESRKQAAIQAANAKNAENQLGKMKTPQKSKLNFSDMMSKFNTSLTKSLGNLMKLPKAAQGAGKKVFNFLKSIAFITGLIMAIKFAINFLAEHPEIKDAIVGFVKTAVNWIIDGIGSLLSGFDKIFSGLMKELSVGAITILGMVIGGWMMGPLGVVLFPIVGLVTKFSGSLKTTAIILGSLIGVYKIFSAVIRGVMMIEKARQVLEAIGLMKRKQQLIQQTVIMTKDGIIVMTNATAHKAASGSIMTAGITVGAAGMIALSAIALLVAAIAAVAWFIGKNKKKKEESVPDASMTTPDVDEPYSGDSRLAILSNKQRSQSPELSTGTTTPTTPTGQKTDATKDTAIAANETMEPAKDSTLQRLLKVNETLYTRLTPTLNTLDFILPIVNAELLAFYIASFPALSVMTIFGNMAMPALKKISNVLKKMSKGILSWFGVDSEDDETDNVPNMSTTNQTYSYTQTTGIANSAQYNNASNIGNANDIIQSKEQPTTKYAGANVYTLNNESMVIRDYIIPKSFSTEMAMSIIKIANNGQRANRDFNANLTGTGSMANSNSSFTTAETEFANNIKLGLELFFEKNVPLVDIANKEDRLSILKEKKNDKSTVTSPEEDAAQDFYGMDKWFRQ